ncbi:uncharacterized protein TNCV_590881 [Trichonephila clavipes]|nr:uncharacterized protein TNCV_590881 [Trichonephila clavipes]
MLNAIHYELDRTVVSCCDTLLWNPANNLAESFMSQFCKTSGGKRVDHSKAGSLERRAKIAALAFQSPAQQWITNVNKVITGKSPKSSMQKFLTARRNERDTRIRRRRLFQNEKNQNSKRKTIT